MARDGGWILPDPLTTDERICFQINIPNDRQHIAAFLGAIWELQYWWNWQRDSAQSGAIVARFWRGILREAIARFNLREETCQELGNTGAGCDSDCGEDMRLRVENCILQMSCNGGETWQDIADLTECINATTAENDQPSPGGETTPGECLTYHVSLNANSKWLLPVAIAGGDTITITNLAGGWTDGTARWFCPDGANYFLGDCGILSANEAGDPIPTIPHMALIGALSDETDIEYIEVLDGTVSLLDTLEPQSLWFQANDDTLGDNGGTIQFDLEICKAAAPEPPEPPAYPWYYEMDFTSARYPDEEFIKTGNEQLSPNPAKPWLVGHGYGQSRADVTNPYNQTLEIRLKAPSDASSRVLYIMAEVVTIGDIDPDTLIYVTGGGAYTSLSSASGAQPDGLVAERYPLSDNVWVADSEFTITVRTTCNEFCDTCGFYIRKLTVAGDMAQPELVAWA